MRLLPFLKLNKSTELEQSARLRLAIFLAMLVPLLALARVNGNLWPHIIIAGLGMGLGHWYSYHNLARNHQLMRAIMFGVIHLAVGWLCVGLFAGFVVPQAQFAIFAQAITSFDLRYRRSLFNTLIHSLANLYIAASLSRSVELGLYLLLFIGLVLAAFFIAERESGQRQASLTPLAAAAPVEPRRLTLFGVGFGALLIVGVLVTFIFTPRFANNPIVPPFSLNVPLRGGVKSEIVNPGVPLVQINGWSDETGDYFFGFDSNLDLRYRGGLSDNIVMYVRSPSRSYWRSHSYDFYDGIIWSQSDKSLIEIKRRGVRFQMRQPLGAPLEPAPPPGEAETIVQTFNIMTEQPNLIFAAYRPSQIFISAENISVDSGDGLRLPENLEAGITYSVVSERPDFNTETLRQASTAYPPEITERYLQLPPNISERVKNLARQLTAPHETPYDKILALNHHLLAEYPYNFFPPPHPPGAEVVDTFLFEDQEGFCEQYVTSLVVMARTLGIPARLVSGYGAGDYNPITNYYEVRYSHAHSWAEVYFPGHGWVPFDPTPGWTPQPYPTPAQNWLFANNGRVFGLEFPILPAGAIVAGGAAGLAFFLPFLLGAALLVGLILLAIELAKRLRPALAAGTDDGYSSVETDPRRRAILKLYRRAAALLSSQKYAPRRQWESLAEYARRTGSLPALGRLTEAVEIAAYRPQAPDPETVVQAEAALAALKQELARGSPPATGDRPPA